MEKEGPGQPNDVHDGQKAAENVNAAPDLDVAKSENVLKPIQMVPGVIAHTVGGIVGGASLGAGWALGKAERIAGEFGLAEATTVSDSRAFKAGFETWLYANGVWPTIFREAGAYGNDFVPLPKERHARLAMLRSTPLIVSNHVSYLDTLVLPLALEVPKLMAMSDVAKWPLFGQLCKELEMIWVDRSDPDSRKAALQAIADHAEHWHEGDRPLLVWPEGTTSNGRGMKEFKQGAFVPGVPVRPVIIKYTGDWDPANVNFREATPRAGGAAPAFGVDSDDDDDDADSKPAKEGYGDAQWAQQFAGHLIHSCTVLICKPYTPSAAEKADPNLYKANVRELMLNRLTELERYLEAQKLAKTPRSASSDSLFSNVDQLLGAASRNLSGGVAAVREQLGPFNWKPGAWLGGKSETGGKSERTRRGSV